MPCATVAAEKVAESNETPLPALLDEGILDRPGQFGFELLFETGVHNVTFPSIPMTIRVGNASTW